MSLPNASTNTTWPSVVQMTRSSIPSLLISYCQHLTTNRHASWAIFHALGYKTAAIITSNRAPWRFSYRDLDLLTSGSMHAEQLQYGTCVPSLVSIAEAVFLLEHRQTDRQTNRRDWTPYPRRVTSLSCCRQTSTTCSVTPIVLYTKVDAQCDKLVSGDESLSHWASTKVDKVWDKVPEANTRISGDTRIPFQHGVG